MKPFDIEMQRVKQNVSPHAGNSFVEGELSLHSVAKDSWITAVDGKSYLMQLAQEPAALSEDEITCEPLRKPGLTLKLSNRLLDDCRGGTTWCC